MNLLILAGKTSALTLLCGIAPGLLIVPRLRWSPLEKLCGAVAASFIITYLVSFALFCCNAPPGTYQSTTAVYAILAIIGFRQLLTFLRNHQTRRVLVAFAIALQVASAIVAAILLLLLIRAWARRRRTAPIPRLRPAPVNS